MTPERASVEPTPHPAPDAPPAPPLLPRAVPERARMYPQDADGAAAGTPGRTGAGAGQHAAPVRSRAPRVPAVAARAALAGSSKIAAAMSEADLEEGVRALCKDLGILRFHVRDSRGMNRGLPDDILIGARGVLWRECKSQKGRLTPEQRLTGEALTALGQDFAVWRPSDLLSWRIARELVELSGRELSMAGRLHAEIAAMSPGQADLVARFERKQQRRGSS